MANDEQAPASESFPVEATFFDERTRLSWVRQCLLVADARSRQVELHWFDARGKEIVSSVSVDVLRGIVERDSKLADLSVAPHIFSALHAFEVRTVIAWIDQIQAPSAPDAPLTFQSFAAKLSEAIHPENMYFIIEGTLIQGTGDPLAQAVVEVDRRRPDRITVFRVGDSGVVSEVKLSVQSCLQAVSGTPRRILLKFSPAAETCAFDKNVLVPILRFLGQVDRGALEGSLVETVDVFMEAVHRRNVDDIVHFYADDCTAYYTQPSPLPVVGKAGNRRVWAFYFSRPDRFHPAVAHQTLVNPDGTGCSMGHWRADFGPDEGIKSRTGGFIFIWRLREDGWKITWVASVRQSG